MAIFPIANEVTMVTPTHIEQTHINVDLLEYPNLTGIILMSDVTKGKIKSIKKIIKIGKSFPAVITSIDQKNNITLSKKHVSETEAKDCNERFHQKSVIDSIVFTIVKALESKHNILVDKQYIYDTFIFGTSKNTNPDVILAQLKSASQDIETYLKRIGFDQENTDSEKTMILQIFQETIQKKFKEPPVLLETIVEIICCQNNGVLVIKNTLLELSKMATVEFPFKITLVKSPYYSITVKTDNKKLSAKMLIDILHKLESMFKNTDSIFNIIKMPEVTADEFIVPTDNEENQEEFISDTEDF